MPLWLFGRKKRRTGDSSSLRASASDVSNNEKRATGVSDVRQSIAPPSSLQLPLQSQSPPPQTSPRPLIRNESQRKRKAMSGVAIPAPAATTVATTPTTVSRNMLMSPTHESYHPDQPPRSSSVQDITALPGVPKAERDSSPHLRPVAVQGKPVISYNTGRPMTDRSPPSPALLHSHLTRNSTITPQRNRSNRQKDQELREEHIRIMDAPLPIAKRPAGTNTDLLRRDSKKARRTLSKQRPEDPRSSNVSLPTSIPSTMSAKFEQRGWQVGLINVLSPRPTVRRSMPGYVADATSDVEKEQHKTGLLPAAVRATSKKDRRRIDDLADELDSHDLRAVLERDARRKEKKAAEQQDRLERRLKRRAEKQRAEEQREREAKDASSPVDRSSQPAPAAVAPHTALDQRSRESRPQEYPQNDQSEAELVSGLLTPRSMQRDETLSGSSSAHEGTYLRYPAKQDIPQPPFEDPQHESDLIPLTESNPFVDPKPEHGSVVSEHWSPVQMPIEESVLETDQVDDELAAAPTSPPASPLVNAHRGENLAEVPDLQVQDTTGIQTPLSQQPRRASESSTRRAGTWASIFRRVPSLRRPSPDHPPSRAMPSEGSFANVSRDSMTRQAIPSHLVEQPGRRSATPVRTQSRFREDLPDVSMSPPESRVQSPDLSIAAANAAAARRAKRITELTDPASVSDSSDLANTGRNDSPVIFGDHNTEVPISQSLASVDSEGSWISGRPQRRSTRRLQRDSGASAVSAAVHTDDFTGSYEKLPMPEHEYFNSLRSQAGDRPRSAGATPQSMESTNTPAATSGTAKMDSTPLRHGTVHRRPTVVHNEQLRKSREGMVAEFMIEPDRPESRASSISEQGSLRRSTLQRATSSASVGGTKVVNIPPSRSGSRNEKRGSNTVGSTALQQSKLS